MIENMILNYQMNIMVMLAMIVMMITMNHNEYQDIAKEANGGIWCWRAHMI